MLLAFSCLLNHNVVADLIGIALGHVYYFLEDVYARDKALGGLGGPRIMGAPAILEAAFAEPVPEGEPVPAAERAGGFVWGEGMALGGADGGGGQ